MTDTIEGMEAVAYRRLVAGLADVDDSEEWTEMNPIERVDAAVSRVEDLEEENRQLRLRVDDLEAQVDPDPTGKDYEDLTRDAKVRKIRETLVDEATSRPTGRSKMGYKDVLFLFDNRPSPGHAYDLMRIAGEADGFEYTDSNGKAVRVKSDAVKDETLFHGANKTSIAEAD